MVWPTISRSISAMRASAAGRSVTLRPSRRITMRSELSTISCSRCEMSTTEASRFSFRSVEKRVSRSLSVSTVVGSSRMSTGLVCP